MRFRTVALLVILLASAGVALAQETTGTLRGRVGDAQGLPVPGAAVTASGPQGSKSAVSDADGRFSIPFLTPGVYAVRAELPGSSQLSRGRSSSASARQRTCRSGWKSAESRRPFW